MTVFKSLSIRHKLTLSASIGLTLMLTLIAVGTYAYFRNATENRIFQEQFTLVSTIAEGFDNQLLQSHKSLIATAAIFPGNMPAASAATQK